MKVFISKVKCCKDCPVGHRRTTSWPRSEPVCSLFMDDKECGRRGRVMDNDIYNFSIPDWCPLDNMVENKDDIGNPEYLITANQQEKDPKFDWSRLHNDIVKWKEVI